MSDPAHFLLSHFDRLAEAPGGIAKLRGLILQLAVQGKIVPQDSSETPAYVLVAEISKARGKLVAEKKLRDAAAIAPVADDDQPFAIPLGWEWVRFGYITFCRDGERIPVSSEERKTRKRIYDYYGASGAIDKIDGFLFDKPLLLIGEDGANLVNRSTPIAFIARGKYWVNNHAHVLDGISEDFLRYVALFINSIDLKPYVTGTAQPKMNQAKMNSIPVALPPLAEQRRIVAKVEELMGLCDALEGAQQEREAVRARLRTSALHQLASPDSDSKSAAFVLQTLSHLTRAPEDFADLRQAILTLAVQGKLAPTKTNDKPTVACAPVDEAELPWPVPSSWQWVRLGDIANIKHGYAFSSDSFTSKATPYVLTTPGNFYESGGFRDRGSKTKYFKGDVPPSFVLNKGDLIIPMTEQAAGLLGSPAFIPDDGKSYLHNQRLGKLEFSSDDVSPEFVFWYFNTEFFRGELARSCTGMKVRHTSPKRILIVPFPLPPLAEQRRIVAKVDELMAVLDALEAALTTARTTAAALLAATLARLSDQPSTATTAPRQPELFPV